MTPDRSNTETHSLGLVGFGRINSALYEFASADPQYSVEYVLRRSPSDALPGDIQLTDPDELADRPVDLVVEGATPEAFIDLAPTLLDGGDLMVLSGSALVDRTFEADLEAMASEHGRAVYLPHAALFGLDGLVDARSELESVTIEATKAPDHLDFSFTDSYQPEDVEGRTVLYDGPVRGLCEHFPRNFNSHAAVALAGLGLDETTSTLIADPEATTAKHVIEATGPGFTLEAVRDSEISGVTGDYTIVSVWGSIKRVLGPGVGLQII